MKVVLAGYNVDADILEALKERCEWDRNDVTPESLSASYARISRDPRDIGELRVLAREDVEKSRKSNAAIIFGMGHASVAEHAVFNFDITGLSRLATEELQRFRLASFTEKSQRYVTLDEYCVIPKEITDAGFADKLSDVICQQSAAYSMLHAGLRAHLFAKHSDLIESKEGKEKVAGWAKEDARYVMPLATETQMGMTINARSLEHMIRKLSASDLDEVRELAQSLYTAAHKLAPSVIKYTKATTYDTLRVSAMDVVVKDLMRDAPKLGIAASSALASVSQDPDTSLIAALIFAYGTYAYDKCYHAVQEMSHADRHAFVRTALTGKQHYDKPDKVFEMVNFSFALTVSATNYAQLKRHRIMTQLPQRYDIALGTTRPPTIAESGFDEMFDIAVGAAEDLYKEMVEAGVSNHAAEYVLTNAHKRKIIVKMNARELYHFVTLRSDEHAQWDIRATSNYMKDAAQQLAPLTTMLLQGKSE